MNKSLLVAKVAKEILSMHSVSAKVSVQATHKRHRSYCSLFSGNIVFSNGVEDAALEHVVWIAAHECGHRILNHHRLYPAWIIALIESISLFLVVAYALSPTLFWVAGLPVAGLAIPIFAARIRCICEEQANAFAAQAVLAFSKKVAASSAFCAAAMTVPEGVSLN